MVDAQVPVRRTLLDFSGSLTHTVKLAQIVWMYDLLKWFGKLVLLEKICGTRVGTEGSRRGCVRQDIGMVDVGYSRTYLW